MLPVSAANYFARNGQGSAVRSVARGLVHFELAVLHLNQLLHVAFGPCMDGSPLARGSLSVLQLLVGAAMYPTCRCGLSCAAGHNAIRAAQVPIGSSHLKCTAQLGFPDPAVSTGFVH